jgi:hypothetical protein
MALEIAGWRHDAISLPGRAGRLQATGATAALLAELGDNYQTYHEFLAGELARIGTPPGPEDFMRDMTAAIKSWDYIQSVVKAEAALRVCRGARKLGRSFGDRPDTDPPLLDDQQRLVSVETRTATPGQSSRPAATADRPVKWPKWVDDIRK